MIEFIVWGLFTIFLAPFLYQLLMEKAEPIANWVVNRTADRQPEAVREERRAEWIAHIKFTKGSASQLIEALGFACRYFIRVPKLNFALGRRFVVHVAISFAGSTWGSRTLGALGGAFAVAAIFRMLDPAVSTFPDFLQFTLMIIGTMVVGLVLISAIRRRFRSDENNVASVDPPSDDGTQV